MAKMKNVAYYTMQCIKENNEVIEFQPGEVKEVEDQVDVDRFIDRYPKEMEVVVEPVVEVKETVVEAVDKTKKKKK